MINVAAQGSTLTLMAGDNNVSDISFKDLSDEGTPVEFGQLDTIQTGFDLNLGFYAWHRPIAPMFSINPIPGSATDRKLRAFLLSSLYAGGAKQISASNIRIDKCVFEIPAHDGEGKTIRVTMSDGYLVGGTAFIGVRADGRMTSFPYRFVFKDMNDNGGEGFGGESGKRDQWVRTKIMKYSEEIEGLYFAKIGGNSSARLISHPIETGAIIYDQKYVEPSRLNVSVKVPVNLIQDMEFEFSEMLKDRTLRKDGKKKTPYSVVAKATEYKNLSLVNYAHDETSDAFDLIDYTLQFQELLFSTTKGHKETLNPSDSDEGPVRPTGLSNTR